MKPLLTGALALIGLLATSWIAGTLWMWFPVLLIPGPGELWLASQDTFGPTFSPTHRAQAIAAYRIRGTRNTLLRYVRNSVWDPNAVFRAVAAVQAKVLQLHGTADEEVPLSAAERLQTQLRDSRLAAIEGASDFVMIDAPEKFASEVEAFLSNTDHESPKAISEVERQGVP